MKKQHKNVNKRLIQHAKCCTRLENFFILHKCGSGLTGLKHF